MTVVCMYGVYSTVIIGGDEKINYQLHMRYVQYGVFMRIYLSFAVIGATRSVCVCVCVGRCRP